jgi:hypothetical protein
MLMRADRSVLLLVDLQERLQPAIHDAPLVLEASIWLTRVAQRLADSGDLHGAVSERPGVDDVSLAGLAAG